MKISRAGICHYSLPLTRRITVSGTPVTHREGYLLCLKDDTGNTGYGEISPLPGLDSQSLDSCMEELIQATRQLNQQPLQIENFSMTARLLGLTILKTPVNRHVMFGLESALLSLACQHDPEISVSVYKVAATGPSIIEVNGLYVPDLSKTVIQSQLDQLKTSGVSTIKIKIGRIAVQDEIDQIRTIQDFFNHDITLRLDANKALSLETYQRYYDALGDIPVEYVEEPLLDGDFTAAAKIPWPLALDESLNLFLDAITSEMTGVPEQTAALIVKPSSFSGLSGLYGFIQKAETLGLKVVLSSAFNTGLTVSLLGSLALVSSGSIRTAHGLDTLKYLKQDVITDPPVIRNGRLSITGKQRAGRVTLNTQCLRQVV